MGAERSCLIPSGLTSFCVGGGEIGVGWRDGFAVRGRQEEAKLVLLVRSREETPNGRMGG